MSPQLQIEETAIDRAIVNEVVALTPEWWKSAILEVALTEENDIVKMRHAIYSSENDDQVVASDELMQLTYELAELFRRYDAKWTKVKYNIVLQSDESWKYTVDFSYS
jgi:hypothetical protein